MTSRWVFICKKCRVQTNVAQGTLLSRTRIPLKTWFRVAWHICEQKNGISALGLQRAMGFGSYHTAWEWLHRMRRVMVLPGRSRELESADGGHWLERSKPAAAKPSRPTDNSAEDGASARPGRASTMAAVPSWRLKAPRRIMLVPYFLAGAEGGGVRTMFPTRPAAGAAGPKFNEE